MTEDIKLSRSAAVKFLNTLSEAKDMTLVDFDTEVRVAKYGQRDFPRMVERIRGRDARRRTPRLYDAMGVYLDGASEDDGRKILVRLHRRRRHPAARSASATSMTLHPRVRRDGVLRSASSSTRAATSRSARTCMQIAEATGGQAFLPDDDEGHRGGLRQGRRADPRPVQPRVHVDQHEAGRRVAQGRNQVSRPDLKGTKILARRGYFAPVSGTRKT